MWWGWSGFQANSWWWGRSRVAWEHRTGQATLLRCTFLEGVQQWLRCLKSHLGSRLIFATYRMITSWYLRYLKYLRSWYLPHITWSDHDHDIWEGTTCLDHDNDICHIPHDQTVENGVEEQHAHATRHGEGVPCQRAHLNQLFVISTNFFPGGYVIFISLDLIIPTHPNIVPLGPDTHLLVEREVWTTEAKGDVGNQTLRTRSNYNFINLIKRDFLWKAADVVRHKYYFATFGIFQSGRHKSWRKSRDPHFSLSYKWETLFNASKKRFI